ncbi:Ras guanine nucleotide exchange factor bud5 [Microbotryomycetes sp. JL221]|nr:Ras guanine nucleotide exchange factor bud5 [Microbotryomycetes sp. JL221]
MTDLAIDTILVRALHSFDAPVKAAGPVGTSNVDACLSFKSGQFITVFHKDNSGWWDGQLDDGQRGWFPSNYVELVTTNGHQVPSQSRTRSVSADVPRESDPSNATVPATDLKDEALTSVMSTLPSPDPQQAIKDSVANAVGLLSTAVASRRVPHYQPSTACIISAVRTLLSATSCLTRESTILKAHPALASSRKRILAALASLVNQARKASAPTATSGNLDDTEERRADAEQTLRLAMVVQECANDFLTQVSIRNVTVQHPLTIGSTDDGTTGTYERKGSIDSIAIGAGTALRQAKSTPDLRANASRQSRLSNGSAIPPLPTPNPPPLPPKNERMSIPVFSSIQPNQMISNSMELSNLMTTIHDALLSTIAALIGHVHAHSRTSHASSFAQMIDLTRETIERVRDVLVVVEAVTKSSAFTESLGTPVADGSLSQDALEAARERLYISTTSLVTAARVATSTPLSASQPSTPNPEALFASPNADDQEKTQLLSSATGVLRAGGDCISLIKALLTRVGSQTHLGIVLKPSEGATSPATIGSPVIAQSSAQSPSLSPTTSRFQSTSPSTSPSLTGRRQNAHTLSMLGRKASSLVPLRDLYGHRVALEEGNEDEMTELASRSPVEFQDAPDEFERRGSQLSWHSAKTGRDRFGSDVGLGVGAQAMARQGSHASSAGATSDTVTEVGSPSPELGGGRAHSPTMSKQVRGTSRQGLHSASASSGTTSSIAMSRGDSARTSESAASSRTALSRTSTGDTSPRSSFSTTRLPPPSLDLTKQMIVDATSPSALASPSTMSSMAGLSLRTTASSSNLGSSTRSLDSPVSVMSNATTTSSGPNSAKARDATPWFLKRDHDAREISFNADGHVTGGTLRALVERLTLHDTTIDTTFSNTFFLTFRLFATPLSLAETLFARFDVQPPSMTTADGHTVGLKSDEFKMWQDRKLKPVRLRVYNSFKTWVESHWSHESDEPVVEPLLVFCKTKLTNTMPSAATRLIDLVNKKIINVVQHGTIASPTSPTTPVTPVHPAVAQHRGLTRMQSMERFRVTKLSALTLSSTSSASTSSSHSTPATALQGTFTGPPPPQPVVSRSVLSSLRTGHVSVVDIDPLELARQLTIIESRLYCAIKPSELLGQEFAKKGPDHAVSVRAMSTLSTKLTGWISETILNEHDAKKRTALLKYFVKLGDRCLTLDNYNTLFAVLCALNSSTIARLRKTWDGLGTKYRTMLDQQRKATEHSRNYAEYRSKIRNAVPPCLPFVGLFLTDMTMCVEGNPQERPSPVDPSLRLINFDRYQKMARVVGELKRFQHPYNLAQVLEIQEYLKSSLDDLTHGGDAHSLYRQSLLVEPRDVAPSIASAQTTKSDFFGWRN